MFKYPKVSEFDIVFGGYPQDWFREHVRKDFQSPENKSKYERIVHDLFFKGGTIPHKNNSIDGLNLFKAILHSFEPKHEDKVRVCALILEDLNQ